MRPIPVFRTLLLGGLLFILTGLPALSGAGSARASGPDPRSGPLLSVVPGAANAGASVTLVGANFHAATGDFTPTVTLAFTDAAGTAVTLPPTTTTDVGSFTVDVAVPAGAAAGPAIFSATDVSGTLATAPFDVRPVQTAASITPSVGAPGTATTLTGSGFAAGQPLTVTLSEGATGSTTTILAAGTVTTTSTGQFTVPIVIPGDAAAGTASITVRDRDNNGATAPFTVVRSGAPALLLVPSTVRPSQPVTVSGINFAAAEPITVTFGPMPSLGAGTLASTLVSGTVTTDSSGAFTATTTIPATAAGGTEIISATDQAGNMASFSVTVVTTAPAIAVVPASVNPTLPVTVTGDGFAPAQPYTITFAQQGAAVVLASGMVSGTGALSTTATVPASALTGTATISATDALGDMASATVLVGLPPQPDNGPTTLYFAEGYTGLLSSNNAASFDETLSILNNNPFTATVTILYLIQSGAPLRLTRQLAPNTMLRESVNKDVGPDRTVAAVISSPAHITAERVINRTGQNGVTLGASTSLGNPNLGTTFYFPAGATGPSYMEYLALVNPGSQEARVSVSYVTDAVSTTGVMSATLVVPAQGRATHRVGNDGSDNFATTSTGDVPVGMVVTSDQPLMAERVLYFGNAGDGGGGGSGAFGATTQAGIMTAGTQYLFGYGSSGGTGLGQRTVDHAEITVLNPAVSPMAATVLAQFSDDLGQTLGVTSVVVAPGTRQTIDASAVVSDTGRVYATLLTSSSPFVAEQSQYLGGRPETGAYPGFTLAGAPAGVTSVAFPDLSPVSGSGMQMQQTVFLHNPTSTPITVTGTYYSDRGCLSLDYTVAPHGITTVDVDADAAALHAKTLGGAFIVSSLGAQDSFVATNVANSVDGRSYTGTQGSLAAL